MLAVERTVRADVAAPMSRCLALLGDIEGYPRWARLVRSAATHDGQLRVRAEILGMTVEMECALEVGPEGAVLRRLPYDANDDERFTAAWAVRPAGAGTAVELHVSAVIDVPGPAGLLRGRIERSLADNLLADFAAEAAAPS
jgi:polyketide cyclase/dehydrase/lipid transport protein